MLEAQRDALEDFVGHIKVIRTKKLNCNINTVENLVRAEEGKAQDGVQRHFRFVLNAAYDIVNYAEAQCGDIDQTLKNQFLLYLLPSVLTWHKCDYA